MPQKTVLIVEDSIDLADTLHDMLVLHGYNALVALSGKDAIALAVAEHPDLIMLDIRLPDITGYEVLHSIRQDAWGKDARFMILTASESLENISKNVDLPVKYILFKPECSISHIIERIESRLNETLV
jgi:DNA-binding response OmpR family regulator